MSAEVEYSNMEIDSEIMNQGELIRKKKKKKKKKKIAQVG